MEFERIIVGLLIVFTIVGVGLVATAIVLIFDWLFSNEKPFYHRILKIND